jgi:hypothetical protein
MAWHGVNVAFDPVRAVAQVELAELAPRREAIARGRVILPVSEPWPQVSAFSLTSFGALLSPEPAFFFDGQLEAPRIVVGSPPDLVISGAALGIAPDRALAAWDFASDMTSQTFADRGPGALHGAFVNLPTRAMKGSNWSGREMAWRNAPVEYGAVHFHSDDVGDVGWRESLELTIPEDLPSGVYALRVDNGLASDHIPFFVLPHAKRRSGAPRHSHTSPMRTMRAATGMRPSRLGRRNGGRAPTTPTSSATSASRPTITILTGRGLRCRHAGGRCSPCGPAILRFPTRAARGCATSPPTAI